MGVFNDNDDLNDMFKDWERRMREHRKKIKDEGSDDSDGENQFNNLFNSMKDFTPTSDDFRKLDELGAPDSIEEFEEHGMKFTRKTWETEDGEYVLVESVGAISGSDLEEVLRNAKKGPFQMKEVSLDEALEDAIEDENYEEAAKLRDEIKDKKINDELFKGR